MKSKIYLSILLIFFAIVFTYLLYTHMLQPKFDGLYSGGATWGDLAIHLDYISGFNERGLKIITDNPIFSGEKLAYPFIPDLLTAILQKFVPLNLALILPTLIASIASVFAIFKLTKKMTGNNWSGFIAPILFFFNGSLVGLYYYYLDAQKFGGVFQYLSKMDKEYAHLAEFDLRFSNVIVDYILPQRTFVWGLILGLIAIYFLWEKKYFKYAITLGLMPLFHTHTFMSFAMASVIYFLFNPSKKLYWAGILAICLALPQMTLLLKSTHSDFVRWQIGWMADKNNLFVFWMKNLPVHLLLLIPAYLTANRQLKKFTLPFLFLIIITNLFQFQPHSYDNMKIMLWAFLLVCILIADFLSKISKLLSIFLFVLLTAVGFLSVYRESYTSWRLFSHEDVRLAEFVKFKTNPDSLFLTSDFHNNPVNCLAGRKVYLGFKGWLWTHGIDYLPREKVVRQIYQGDPQALNKIRENNISYVLLEKSKYADLNINEEFFKNTFPLVFESQSYLLFKTLSE